jgi:ABC-2 type transport system permease protein
MNELNGTRPLLSTNLRRDKLLLPICVATFAAVAGSSAAATAKLYPDAASRALGAELINATPALVAMYGRVYDPTSLGAVGLIKLTGFGTVMVGLFALLVVIRHTRADEELGRYELLAGGSIGRFASLAAALMTAAIGVVGVGVVTALALIVAGLPASGSLAFGLSWTVGGLAFAGVGAVAAQLTSSARAARGLAGGALAVAYVLRAAGDSTGDTEPAWPSWLSPIGWAQQIRPYAGDRWALALLPAVFGAVLVALAIVLARHRDLGAGLLPQRRGAAQAPPLLAGPFGLAWRLQRAAFLGWLVAFVLLSLVVGQIVTRIGDMLRTPVARQLIAALGGVGELTKAFVAVELSFVAVFAAAYGISSILRLAGEESATRADLILSTPSGRLRWALSHLVIAVVGTGILMLACGLGVGLAHALESGDPSVFGADLLAAVVRLPAVWVLVGASLALYGLSRRAAPIAWAVLVATFLASEIGPLLDLPRWVRELSPFTHVPNLPGGEVTAGPLLALLAIAVTLFAAGLWALRRRDLARLKGRRQVTTSRAVDLPEDFRDAGAVGTFDLVHGQRPDVYAGTGRTQGQHSRNPRLTAPASTVNPASTSCCRISAPFSASSSTGQWAERSNM